MQSLFALFVDVMGVQRDLVVPNGSPDASSSFTRCSERLDSFRQDLENLFGRDLPLLLSQSPAIPQPSFVAEFSDSAYIIGERFASVAIPALFLMRRALRHNYPLRGGIGFGNFAHETSGVRASREGQIWSTSLFVGSAVVTAYQAERSATPGLRILVHPRVMCQEEEPLLKAYTMPMFEQEMNTDASHELRFWRNSETAAATLRLQAFRDSQILSERAVRHYDATIAAYGRFSNVNDDLPFALPAL